MCDKVKGNGKITCNKQEIKTLHKIRWKTCRL